MRILVTGGAGYKGVLLSEELLQRGHDVTILDNFMYGYDSVLHLLRFKSLTIKKEDIRNVNEGMVRGFDMIFHLAGISGYPACEANPHSAKLINVDASRRLSECLSPDQMLIYASTTSFYGKSGSSCSEESEVEPVSLYGITKYQAEQSLLQRERAVSLRFATLFGVSPRMRIDLLVNDFVHKAVTERCLVLFESRTKRTFMHLRDAIAAYLFTLEHFESMKSQIYNVGNEALNYSKMEIAEAVRKQTQCNVIDSDMKDFDTRNFLVSYEKIRNLGFLPTLSLDDGISELRRLYDFYRPLATFKTI